MATPDFMEVVDPPALLPPQITLLTQLPPGDFPNGNERGVQHPSGRGAGAGAPVDPGTPGTYSVTDLACGTVQSVSFFLRAPELRPGQSTWAQWRSYEERVASARQNLERSRSFQVARELLYGTYATAATWPTPFLNKAPVQITATAQKPATALNWITNVWHAGSTALTVAPMYGELGIIHAAPAVLRALMFSFGAVEQRGTRFVEKAQGHQVVTDAGYIGSNRTGPGSIDPVATTSWMFMSPNIDIRLGPVIVTPETVNWRANTVTVWAEQVANYTYETPVAGGTAPPVLAIPVDLT